MIPSATLIVLAGALFALGAGVVFVPALATGWQGAALALATAAAADAWLAWRALRPTAVRATPVSLALGVWHRIAVRVHNEVPGIVVPERVQQRLVEAGADAAAVGLDVARDLLADSRERAAGVYVVAPFKQPLGILELLT